MPDFDYTLFAFGLLTGAVATALFLAGLAWGMRLALRSARPMAVLLPSSILRIAMLIAAGWWVAGHGTAAFAGFVLGFMVVRLVVTRAMLPARQAGDAHTTRELTQWK